MKNQAQAEAKAEIDELKKKIEECERKEEESANRWKSCLNDWTLRESEYEESKQQLSNEREQLKKQMSIISVASDFVGEKRRDLEIAYQDVNCELQRVKETFQQELQRGISTGPSRDFYSVRAKPLFAAPPPKK